MVSWKSLLLGAWALLWGYMALWIGLGLARGGKSCTEFRLGDRWVETCHRDYPPFTAMIPMIVLFVLALGCLYFATRSFLRATQADRLRLQAMISERSRAEVRKALRAGRRRLGGRPH